MTFEDFASARQLIAEESIGTKVRAVKRREDAQFKRTQAGLQARDRRR